MFCCLCFVNQSILNDRCQFLAHMFFQQTNEFREYFSLSRLPNIRAEEFTPLKHCRQTIELYITFGFDQMPFLNRRPSAAIRMHFGESCFIAVGQHYLTALSLLYESLYLPLSCFKGKLITFLSDARVRFQTKSAAFNALVIMLK